MTLYATAGVTNLLQKKLTCNMLKLDLNESKWGKAPPTKKVHVKWTNSQGPNEFDYEFDHSIFKNPSAPPR